MNSYELMLVLSASLNREKQDQTVASLKKIIEKQGGKVNKVDNWGKRELAYQIAKQTEAVYYLLHLTAPGAIVHNIDKDIRDNESIMRHLLLRKGD